MLKFSNFGKSQVSIAPSGTGGLSFTVADGLLFPSLATGDYFYGIFKDASGNREVVKVEARSGNAMTIAVGGRGLDGTTARTWAATDYFVAGLTNIALQESLANANLQSIGALVSAADKLPYFTGAGTSALTGLSAFIRTLLDDADAGAALTTLGISAFIQTLLNDADAATARTTLGAAGLTGSETIAGTKTFSTPIAIGSGGTGANTAAAAFAALKQAATTSATGVVELATDAEAMAGTDTTRAVTAAGIASGYELASSYAKLPGGLILQWGLDTTTLAAGGGRVVTLPIAFPGAIAFCSVSVQSTTVNNPMTTPFVQITTLSSFTIVNTDVDSGISVYRWFAIGY